MSSDYNLIHRMERAAVKVHEEIKAEQIRHVPLDEYTEERVATLLAKVAERRRWWPVREWKVNL